MGKITIVKTKTQKKYFITLPKNIMESWNIQKGDALEPINFMGDTITFKLERQK